MVDPITLALIAKQVAPLAQAALGGVQTAVGTMQRKRAKSLIPNDVDPMEVTQLNDINNRIEAFRTGTAFGYATDANTRLGKDLVRKTFTGGRGLMSAINATTREIGHANAKVAQMGLQGEATYMEQKQRLVERMSARKLQLGLLRYTKASADAENNIKDGKANLMAGGMDILSRIDSNNTLSAKKLRINAGSSEPLED
jgi:hypothetical protein